MIEGILGYISDDREPPLKSPSKKRGNIFIERGAATRHDKLLRNPLLAGAVKRFGE
jgi:hypothetical protein